MSQTLCAGRGIIPNPLRCIDVTRATHTTLDVLQDSRVDDCWNIDGSRDCQIHGQVSHNLQEKPPENKCGSGRD